MNKLKNHEVKHSQINSEKGIVEFEKDSKKIKKEKEMKKIDFSVVSQV
jgi:hypothetical protein